MRWQPINHQYSAKTSTYTSTSPITAATLSVLKTVKMILMRTGKPNLLQGTRVPDKTEEPVGLLICVCLALQF